MHSEILLTDLCFLCIKIKKVVVELLRIWSTCIEQKFNRANNAGYQASFTSFASEVESYTITQKFLGLQKRKLFHI